MWDPVKIICPIFQNCIWRTILAGKEKGKWKFSNTLCWLLFLSQFFDDKTFIIKISTLYIKCTSIVIASIVCGHGSGVNLYNCFTTIMESIDWLLSKKEHLLMSKTINAYGTLNVQTKETYKLKKIYPISAPVANLGIDIPEKHPLDMLWKIGFLKSVVNTLETYLWENTFLRKVASCNSVTLLRITPSQIFFKESD